MTTDAAVSGITLHMSAYDPADIRNHDWWRCGDHRTCFSGLNWSVHVLIININRHNFN
jgi:hypothetical protein